MNNNLKIKKGEISLYLIRSTLEIKLPQPQVFLFREKKKRTNWFSFSYVMFLFLVQNYFTLTYIVETYNVDCLFII